MEISTYIILTSIFMPLILIVGSIGIIEQNQTLFFSGYALMFSYALLIGIFA